MIETLLEKALTLDEEQQLDLFAKLAADPETALRELVSILQHPKKRLWPIANQVIRFIGYPLNASLIPLLVDHLCDGNWPGWNEAILALAEIDPVIVTPFFIELLLDWGKKREYWESDVEGLCLALLHMKIDYISPCIPSIVSILATTGELDEPDPEILLRSLMYGNIHQYPYTIPLFIHIVSIVKRSDVREHARTLLESFSSENLAPYQLVMYQRGNET